MVNTTEQVVTRVGEEAFERRPQGTEIVRWFEELPGRESGGQERAHGGEMSRKEERRAVTDPLRKPRVHGEAETRRQQTARRREWSGSV